MGLGIKKGDKVFIRSGRDKGKTGKVITVYPKKNRALVEGVNMVKKHVRKSQTHPQGAILNKELPIHLSNLSLMDAHGKPTRIGVETAKDGSKQRIAMKTKAVIGS